MSEKISNYSVVVLDRGWVYVGQTSIEGEWCLIRAAQNIRYWGTKRGLGQLALEGPTENTKLDPAGTVRAPLRAVIAVLDTEESLWKRS